VTLPAWLVQIPSSTTLLLHIFARATFILAISHLYVVREWQTSLVGDFETNTKNNKTITTPTFCPVV
jgi:hypothetical protein